MYRPLPWLGYVKTYVVGLGIGVFALVASAQTVEVGGVKFDNRIQLAGQELALNGAGVRYRAIFKVSAIGLYLPARADTLDAVMLAPGAKRIRIVLLRSLNANDLGKMLSTGVEANASRQEFAAALPAIMRLGELSAELKELPSGEVITVDWEPGKGTYIRVANKVSVGPYKELDVFSGIAKIWLGKFPTDVHLKDALLGQSNRGG